MKTSYKYELTKAQQGQYAIGGFNFDNLAMMKGIITAAETVQAPVLLMVTESSALAMGVDYVIAMTKVARACAKVPVIIHWDHGHDLNLIKKVIDSGFDSVMLDASLAPIEQNIAETKQVVAWARAKKVEVESEIGHVGGKEDDTESNLTDCYTEPKAAIDFVNQTKIDGLAVAVGTIHGIYHQPVHLQIELIKQIRQLIDIPLVLHGSSGVPADQLQSAIKAGISKVNIGTDLKVAYADGIKASFQQNPALYDVRKFSAEGVTAMIPVVIEKMRLLGSAHRV